MKIIFKGEDILAVWGKLPLTYEGMCILTEMYPYDLSIEDGNLVIEERGVQVE